MATLAAIGNLSRDVATYPDGRRHQMLGGAALQRRVRRRACWPDRGPLCPYYPYRSARKAARDPDDVALRKAVAAARRGRPGEHS